MHYAAEKNMIEVLDQFHGQGGDFTIQNKAGFTCLHIAAKEGHADLCKMLLARGCPPEVRDQFGFSASYWAHEFGHSECVAALPAPLKVSKEEFYEHMK